MNGVRRRGGEAGETLVEVLVALSILGLAAVAILAGLELSVKSSDLHRKEATGGSYVRSLAEAIQNDVAANGYQTCGGAGYLTSAVRTAAGIPSTYTPTVLGTSAWTTTGWTPCTASNDKGVQRLDLSVTSPGDASHTATETLTVIIRKPCNGALPTPC
jgi:type II secretory pathway pseudopilin PulG